MSWAFLWFDLNWNSDSAYHQGRKCTKERPEESGVPPGPGGVRLCATSPGN
jgi:hypothetical protein